MILIENKQLNFFSLYHLQNTNSFNHENRSTDAFNITLSWSMVIISPHTYARRMRGLRAMRDTVFIKCRDIRNNNGIFYFVFSNVRIIFGTKLVTCLLGSKLFLSLFSCLHNRCMQQIFSAYFFNCMPFFPIYRDISL